MARVAPILCLYAVEFFFFFLLLGSHPLASLLPQRDSISLFLGIASRDVEYYSADVISCRDGSKSFTKDRLNDGFCDCPDGTDEPGTSACPESRFHCRNTGDIPRMLYSSRVNDGICDCCDGSDEYDGYTTCPNTCSRGQAASNNSKIEYAERRRLDRIREQAKRMADVGTLVENLTDLRVVMISELVVFCGMMSCVCHWRSRNRRRRYLPKS